MNYTDRLGNINLYNGDCMEFMKDVPDKYYDLAIVDPPYGLPKTSKHGRGKLKSRLINSDCIQRWDIPPNKYYFTELFRVSKEQIIWGGNYFELPRTRGFVIWDKEQPFDNFSAVEYAWVSFQYPSKIFRLATTKTGDETKIHPTQKPIALYKWLLTKYAKEGDKIFDSHFGSLSIGIACHNLGFELDACELDKEYYKQAKKRLINFQRQLTIF